MVNNESTKDEWISNISTNWFWEFNDLPQDLMTDADIWKEIVKSRPSLYASIPESLKENRDIALSAVFYDGMILGQLNISFRDDDELVCCAVMNYAKSLQFSSERLRDSDEIISRIDFENRSFVLCKQGNFLRFASSRILRNRDLVLKAIQNDEWEAGAISIGTQPLISYLDVDMQEDFELAKLSVLNNYQAFDFLPNALKGNAEIIELVLDRLDGNTSNLTLGMRNSLEIMEKFCKINLNNLVLASNEIKDNEQFILELIKIDSMCLQYTTDRIRDLKEIVLIAVNENALAVQFASLNLKNNYEIGLASVTENGEALEFLSEELRDNLEIVSMAISEKKRFRKKTYGWGNSEKEEVLVKDGCAIRWASKRLRSNRELVVNSITNSNEKESGPFGFSGQNKYNDLPLAMYLDSSILEDKEIALKLISNNPHSRKYINPKVVLAPVDYDRIKPYLNENQQPNRNVISKIAKIKMNFPGHSLLNRLESGEVLFIDEINYSTTANVELTDFMTFYFGQIISK